MVQKFVRTVLASPNSNFIRVISCLSEQKKKQLSQNMYAGATIGWNCGVQRPGQTVVQPDGTSLVSVLSNLDGGASTSAPLLRTKQTTGEMGRTVRRVEEGY